MFLHLAHILCTFKIYYSKKINSKNRNMTVDTSICKTVINGSITRTVIKTI